jgi:hypothetical protein
MDPELLPANLLRRENQLAFEGRRVRTDFHWQSLGKAIDGVH